MNKTFIFKYLTMLFVGLLVAACEPEVEPADDYLNTKIDDFEILYLKDAVLNEVNNSSFDCPADADEIDCILICHIPPGNPQKRKNLIIPTVAVQAHINHGHDKHDHHDFLGSCSQLDLYGSEAQNNPEYLIDPFSPPTDSTDLGNYQYCNPSLAIDLDCDEIDDETDLAIYY